MELMKPDKGESVGNFPTFRMIVFSWNVVVENCGSKFLRTVGKLLQDYTASPTIRLHSVFNCNFVWRVQLILTSPSADYCPLRKQKPSVRLDCALAIIFTHTHTHTHVCVSSRWYLIKVLCPQVHSFLTNVSSTKP